MNRRLRLPEEQERDVGTFRGGILRSSHLDFLPTNIAALSLLQRQAILPFLCPRHGPCSQTTTGRTDDERLRIDRTVQTGWYQSVSLPL